MSHIWALISNTYCICFDNSIRVPLHSILQCTDRKSIYYPKRNVSILRTKEPMTVLLLPTFVLA